MTQDLLLYQRPMGVRGVFVAGALPGLSPGTLTQGRITLSADVREDGPIDGTAIVGPAGGSVASSSGTSLDIPPGSLPADITVSLASGALPDVGDARLVPLAAVDISFVGDLGGLPLTGVGATLRVQIPGGVDPARDILVTRTVDLAALSGGALSGTARELVSVATVFGEELTAQPGALGLPLPAITESGRYTFIQVQEPVAFVTGEVTAGGSPATSGLVTASTLPFVSLTESAEPFYAVASTVDPVDAVDIRGRSLLTGFGARASVGLDNPGDIVALDLDLTEDRPRVASVSPSPGAAEVPRTATVVVTFTAAMNPATVTGSSVVLREAGGGSVSGTLSVLTGGTRVAFSPSAPLPENTLFEVALDTSLTDTFGQPLLGDEPDGSFLSTFNTLDLTPPEPPAPGEVTASIPEDGTTTITGTPGSAEPNSTVTAINDATGETTTVIANSDGSYTINANASLSDAFTILYIDAAGNETRFALGAFRDADGTTIIGSRGGDVLGPLGTVISVPPNSIPDGTRIRLTLRDLAEFAAPMPPSQAFLRGFSLEMGNVVAAIPFTLSFPAPAGSNPDDQISVFREIDFFGTPALELVEIAEVQGDTITTASPPFPGIGFSAVLAAFVAQSPVVYGQAVASSSANASGFQIASAGGDVSSASFNRGDASFNPLSPPDTGMFVVPVGQTLDTIVYDSAGNPTQFIPRLEPADWEGVLTFLIPGPPGNPPFRVLESQPAHFERDVGLRETLIVGFSDVLLDGLLITGGTDTPLENCRDAVIPQGQTLEDLNCLCVHIKEGSATSLPPSACLAGEVQVVAAPTTGAKNLLTFEPQSAYRIGTTYVANVQGIRDGTAGQTDLNRIVDTGDTIEFTTFAPSILSEISLATGGSIRDVLHLGRNIVVAATDRPGQGGFLSRVDFDPTSGPRPGATISLGNRANGLAVVPSPILPAARFVSVHADVGAQGDVRLWNTALQAQGVQRLTASSDELITGNLPLPIDFGGLPWAVVTQNALTETNVFIATIGVGIQGTTAQTIAEDVRPLPGFIPAGVMQSPIDMEVLDNTLLAADERELAVVPLAGATSPSALDIPALQVAAFPGVGVDRNDDGAFSQDEFFNLAYILSFDGSDRRIHVVEVLDGTPSETASILLPRGLTGARDFAVDPLSQFAFVVSEAGLTVVDVSEPFGGDRFRDVDQNDIDDRVLGTEPGLGTVFSQIDLNDNFTTAFVSDDRAMRLREIAVAPEDLRDRQIQRLVGYEPLQNPDTVETTQIGEANPHIGEFLTTETDLVLPGKGLDFVLSRTYRSRDLAQGPLGFNWTHSYELYLDLRRSTEDGPIDGVTFHDGTGRLTDFSRDADTGQYIPEPGLLADLIIDEDDAVATLDLADGTRLLFTSQEPARGLSRLRIASITDVHSNALTFQHDESGQLTEVTDTRQKTITFNYSGGFLESVTASGDGGETRTVTYTQDFRSDLVQVTSPATTDHPTGITTTYTYSSGAEERDEDGALQPTAQLNHNLLTVTDGRGNTVLENTYNPTTDDTDVLNFDTLTEQTIGCTDPDIGLQGGTFFYSYLPGQTIVTSRSNVVTERSYDPQGHPITIVTKTVEHGDVLEQSSYTVDGLVENSTAPDGVETEFTYNPGAPEFARKGDLTEIRVTGTDNSQLVTSITPGPFGTPTFIRDPEGDTTTFVVNATTGDVERITRDGTDVIQSFTYHPTGELASQTNQFGGETRFVLGASGFVETIKAPEDLEINDTTLTYDGFGNVSTVTDPRGDTTTTVINALGQTEVVDTWRGTETRTYDASGNVEKTLLTFKDTTSPDLEVTTPHHCANQPVSRTETSQGTSRTTSFEFDAGGRLTKQTSPLGSETQFTYEERNRPTTVRTAGGPNPVDAVLATFTYNPRGDAETQTLGSAAESVTTTLTYDVFARPTGQADGTGLSTLATLNGRGEVVTTTASSSTPQLTLGTQTTPRDPAGRVTGVTDAFKELTAQNAANERAQNTSVTYTDGNKSITTTLADPLRVATESLDLLGRTVETTDPAGNRTEITYEGLDVTGVKETFSDGRVVETTFEFDDHGRVTKTTVAPNDSANKRVISFQLDHRDNVLARTEVGGTQTTREFDGFNRLTKVTTGRDVTTLAYDDEDNLIRLEDGRVGEDKNIITRDYDGRQRLTKETFPDGTTREFTYRDDNVVDTFTDRAGNIFEFSYDAAQRLTSVEATTIQADFEGGTTSRTLAYNPLGQTARIDSTFAGDAQNVALTRDGRGAVLSETQNGITVSASTNLSSERTGVGYLGAEGITHSTPRNSLGRIGSLSANPMESFVSDYTFTGPSALAAATFGNGTNLTRTFTGALEEKSRSYTHNAISVTGFTQTRTTSGRLDTLTRTHQTGIREKFRYSSGEQWLESFERLRTVPGEDDEPIRQVDFTHDSAGNWTQRSVSIAGATATDTTFDPNDLNQYDSVGGQALTYDNNGNLRSDGARAFAFGAFGELLSVAEIDDMGTQTQLASYVYDGLGRMIERKTFSTGGLVDHEVLVYDGDHITAVLDATSGAPKQQFVFNDDRPDLPVLLRTGGQDYYYHLDSLGNVVALTTSLGAVVERYEYDPFGMPTITNPDGSMEFDESQVGNRLMYKARPYDARTGLIYMRARFYDPGLGRFVSADPLGTVDGLNLYAFVGNDPANFFDPSGTVGLTFSETTFLGRKLRDTEDSPEAILIGAAVVATATGIGAVAGVGAAIVGGGSLTVGGAFTAGSGALLATTGAVSGAIGVVAATQSGAIRNRLLRAGFFTLSLGSVGGLGGAIGGGLIGQTQESVEFGAAVGDITQGLGGLAFLGVRSAATRLTGNLDFGAEIESGIQAFAREGLLAIEDQALIASRNIAGLSERQALFILRTARSGKNPTSVTFGGSRIRGDFRPGSDLDIGFDNLTVNQATKLIGRIRRNARTTGGLVPERFQIVPGRAVSGAQPIRSAAEFFSRSGFRTAGPRAGQAFGPSGSLTFTPSGRVIIQTP